MEKDSHLIGAILVRNFGVSLRSLQFALDRQRKSGGRIGEILLDMGVITEEQLSMALSHQRERRNSKEPG